MNTQPLKKCQINEAGAKTAQQDRGGPGKPPVYSQPVLQKIL